MMTYEEGLKTTEWAAYEQTQVEFHDLLVQWWEARTRIYWADVMDLTGLVLILGLLKDKMDDAHRRGVDARTRWLSLRGPYPLWVVPA